jgi:hypothetical protein
MIFFKRSRTPTWIAWTVLLLLSLITGWLLTAPGSAYREVPAEHAAERGSLS